MAPSPAMQPAIPLEDAADRAQAKRKHGLVRISLEKIGFWPGNRGCNGVSSYHAHEVAWDIMSKKCRLSRYEPVELMEIPADLLDSFKLANQEKCERDHLMPKFSPTMEYVCAGKTHFVHGLKLGKEGTHTLFNESGAPRIRWKSDDLEADECMKQGPMAAIYDSSIFQRP